MRGSKERRLARSRDRGAKRRGENRWTEEQGEMQKKAGTEGGRRKEKEGVVGTVTEKDCATDGDMESQHTGEQEAAGGAGGGAEHRTAGARLRGSRLGAEARRGEGEADPVTGEISATHAGLGSCGDLGKKRGAAEKGGLPARGRTAPDPWDTLPHEGGGYLAE